MKEPMKAHEIQNDLPIGERSETLAWVHPASDESVVLVLNAGIESEEGRSEWCWLRLPNGDLMLGVFPQGGTYEAVEVDAAYREGTERQ